MIRARPRSMFLEVTAYLALVVAAVVACLVVRHAGAGLQAPESVTGPRFGATGSEAQTDILLHVLIALLAILGAARLLGRIGRLIGQPAVIGESGFAASERISST